MRGPVHILVGLCLVLGGCAAAERTAPMPAVAAHGAAGAELTAVTLPERFTSSFGRSAVRRALAAQTEALTAAPGTNVAWSHLLTRGTVRPGAPYRVNATDCRDLVHEVRWRRQRFGGRVTLCRGVNGRWRKVRR